MPATGPASRTPLSADLRDLLHSRKARLNIGEIVERFEGRGGLGEVIFFLTLPVLLPLPPGASTILALPLLLTAPQMAIGRRHLWLPRWLKNRTLSRKAVARLIRTILPLLEKVEAMGRQRLDWITGRVGMRMTGVAATLIAVILVLPITLANLLPALALAVMALGLACRDGLMLLAGYAVLALAVGIVVLGADGAVLLFHHLKAMA